MKVGVRVGELVFWREKAVPFVQVQRGEECMYHWERLDYPKQSIVVLLEAFEAEQAKNDRLSEQCEDLGRRLHIIKIGA